MLHSTDVARANVAVLRCTRTAAAEGAPPGAKIDLWALASERVATPMPSPAPDVSYGKHEITDRMDVPLVGIGSRRELRGAAPLSQPRHASRRSGGGLGRRVFDRVLDLWPYGDVEVAG